MPELQESRYAGEFVVSEGNPGNQLTVDGEIFLVQGEPERRDPDRLVWILDVRPALRAQVGLFRPSRTNPAMAATTPIAKRIQ
jgi:hypothetical protein